MRTAFFKHVLRADLRSVFLWTLTALGAMLVVASGARAGTSGARAGTTGGAAASSASAAPGSQSTSVAESGQPPAPSATGGAEPSAPRTTRRALATWFGPGFYGSTTACGQKMTPKLLGVASRTLPCGTLVRIFHGGHQVTVPVVDRGPYGRIGAKWDLTAGAARALNVVETVQITTEIVGVLPNTPTLGAAAETVPAQPSSEAAATAAVANTGGAAAR